MPKNCKKIFAKSYDLIYNGGMIGIKTKGQLQIKSKFDGSDVVEMNTPADVEWIGESVSVTYDEDNEGYTSTQSKLCISNDVVSLNRFGQFPAKFIFMQGQKNLGKVTTPMGVVDVSIFTHSLDVNLNKTQLCVHLCYDMTMQDSCTACDMKIVCNFFGGKK